MRERKTDPELPIVLPFIPGQASNGEFVPKARSRKHVEAEALAHEMADRIARKQGVPRRRFLQSSAGIAVTLAAINLVGCDDDDKGSLPDGVDTGGTFDVPTDADPDAVCEKLEGDEFIFDVQTHHVDPEGPWVKESPVTAQFFARFLGGDPSCMEADKLDCISRFYYAHDIFLESDTTLAVLSDTPTSTDNSDPLNFDEMKRTRDIINQLSPPSTDRVKLHSVVVPNAYPNALQDQLDRMQARAEAMDVAAWKIYTPYAPNGTGWQLDDEVLGIPVIEKARELGVKTICAHKGLPLFGFDRAAASPRDIGVVAAAYPDVNFIVYHSGWFPGTREGPYNAENPQGVDVLIKSLEDNGVQPNTNVYAELGSTWRNIMSDPTQAAHLHRQAAEALRRGQRAVGHGLHLDGLAAAADRGVPDVPDRLAVRGAVRLSGADGRGEAQDLRTELGAAVWRRPGDGGVPHRRRRDRAAARRPGAISKATRTSCGGCNRNPTDREGMLRWFAQHGNRWQLGSSYALKARCARGRCRDITRMPRAASRDTSNTPVYSA